MTFNDIIARIGVDKILHFTVGGLITALFTIQVVLQVPEINAYTLLVPIIGAIITMIFAWFKEAIIDDEFSWKDIIASVLGAVPVIVVTTVYTLLNIYKI